MKLVVDGKLRHLLPVALVFLMTACGGGGSGPDSSGRPPPPPPPPDVDRSFVRLTSDPGDFIGDGRSYAYSLADAEITVTAEGGRLTIDILGDESWSGIFQLPETFTDLQPGTYAGLRRYTFHDPAVGGMIWSGEGRGCNGLSGSLTIESVAYDGDGVSEIDFQFEQHCEELAPALHGEIHWIADDPTTAPGPVVPPPAGLWEPADGTTPTEGSFVYLESEPDDYIGAGFTYTYQRTNAVISVFESEGRLGVIVDGDEIWSGDFKAMDSLDRMAVGYYGGLQFYPGNPKKGGMKWSGEGRGCELSGWFVVDSITYENGALATADVRFEQRCLGRNGSLHGKVHWDASETVTTPGPVEPPPGLWEPAPGVTPATGNYVYLESEPDDYIGAGGTYLYTLADTLITARLAGPAFEVMIGSLFVHGDEEWTGGFEGMYTVSRLEPGYYGEVERYPHQNPLKPGLSWTGLGRGCGTITGWFVVDNVVYDGDALVEIDLRFEQHCEDNAPALHGKIHWNVNDPTVAPGPVVPPPAGLWEPPAGATPASGTYVYLESEPGDRIGQGLTYLFTPDNTEIMTDAGGASLYVYVIGDENWRGRFDGMNSITRFEVGYYGDLEQTPTHNPLKGGMDWYGGARRCSDIDGWFVVDSATYDGETLTAIELRFGQQCEGDSAVLYGAIRWSQ